ncbi:ABC transporter ATP-binding protein [Herbiconiux moechotypicola]|uniref:ABC transporter ATP-binding protein n=1 Tax=Herbiconiux moechotypicola TaxID=637393 RepID=A0ABN3DSW5_9MICO|nr:ABC transporter ATP-binding protein [Herbiconiux moechotypicola]MCS5730586.1 ABC transporter ATP-binding protein [Herbiconiux moechotypicola]
MTGTDASPDALEARGVSLGYPRREVIEGLDLRIRRDSFTVLIGPNACGKSTALKGLARLIDPSRGSIVLNGHDIAHRRTRDVARELALLPQSPITPPSVTVGDLVARGRAPYQSLLRQYSRDDERIVRESLATTGTLDLIDRTVDELSGGQRQRVWISVVLAQQTGVLLLDEPTTYLDLAHQIEVLDLCARLHAEGRTLVVVLHDLTLAARYATDIVAFKAGRVVAQGAPAEVITAATVREVFGVECAVIADPHTGTPLVVPARPPHLGGETQPPAEPTHREDRSRS